MSRRRVSGAGGTERAPARWRLAAATALVAAGIWGGPAQAQQRADADYQPRVEDPRWGAAEGPVALLDEAHHNYHTLHGRYAPFARLLRADGWRVQSSFRPFSSSTLAGARVLVIANALHERNVEEWSLPTPSAFTSGEIDAMVEWVDSGGSMLLIADHMPMPGAASELARAFGFEMRNGFAAVPPTPGMLVFRRADGSLARHDVTGARSGYLPVDSVATFVGQGFRPPPEATSLLVLPSEAVSLEPETAWEFDEDTRRVSIGGWSQGALLERGRGRVAVFGEAAAFTAQVGGPDGGVMGLAHPAAGHNARFLLNLMAWLGQPPKPREP